MRLKPLQRKQFPIAKLVLTIAALSAFADVALRAAQKPAATPTRSARKPAAKPVAKPAAKPRTAASKQAASAVPASKSAREAWISRILQKMTLKQKIAQLVIVPFYGESLHPNSRAYRNYVKLVQTHGVGGLILVNRVGRSGIQAAQPHAMAAFLNRMQKLAYVPLIVGADFERGASMRVAETTRFPHTMAFGATGNPEYSFRMGALTAREARGLGVHWVFAPVADVNNNPDNPIINIRSYGEDPSLVESHLAAFLRGVRSAPGPKILTTVKHFPGHGDTAVDSHMGLPVLEVDRKRLDEVELAPFRAAIQNEVDSVMTAHIAVSALDADGVPATVSKPLLTGLLREELGFRGILITDAMDMQGLARQFPSGEASVRAIEAGVDVLLMPSDPGEAIQAVAKAVAAKRITAARIDQSCRRLLGAKYDVGLSQRKPIRIEDISEAIDGPEQDEFALEVAGNALTLVRNEGDLLARLKGPGTCWYALAEGRNSSQGQTLLDDVKARVTPLRTAWFDRRSGIEEYQAAAGEIGDCERFALATFVTSGAFRGDIALPANHQTFVEKILAAGKPVALISFGSPYLLRAFPSVSLYLATFSSVPSSEQAAVQAIFGERPIQGKMPVSIPGLARIGDGISVAAARK